MKNKNFTCLQIGYEVQRESDNCECLSSSRLALGDRPSPLTNGLSAMAARSALRQPKPLCIAARVKVVVPALCV